MNKWLVTSSCISLLQFLLTAVNLYSFEDVFHIGCQRLTSSTVSAAAVIHPTKHCSRTWSNRWASTLTPISTGVWAAERPFVWNSIDVGGRSVIARMVDGSLFVHSPVEWTKELNESIIALGGSVSAIVSPNYEHVKYAAQWAVTYPRATVYGCPGLQLKEPTIPILKELPRDLSDDSSSSAVFYNSFDVLYFDCEINPFTGRPFFNEVVFFHRASKTLLVSDVFWNYPRNASPNYRLEMELEGTYRQHVCSKVPLPVEEVEYGKNPYIVVPELPVPLGTALWKFGMDKVYRPFYLLFMVGLGHRRQRYRAAVDRLLAWDVEVIAPCHGDVVRGKNTCRKVLTEFFL